MHWTEKICFKLLHNSCLSLCKKSHVWQEPALAHGLCCDGMFDVILSGCDTPDHVVMECLM